MPEDRERGSVGTHHRMATGVDVGHNHVAVDHDRAGVEAKRRPAGRQRRDVDVHERSICPFVRVGDGDNITRVRCRWRGEPAVGTQDAGAMSDTRRGGDVGGCVRPPWGTQDVGEMPVGGASVRQARTYQC